MTKFYFITTFIAAFIGATDPASITAFFTGIATLVASVGALLLSWRAASNAAIAQREATEAKSKSDLSEVKADDAASKAAIALAAANETILELKLMNEAKKSEPPTDEKKL